MDSKINLLIAELGETRVKQNVDLSEYLRTGLGSMAEAFFIATTTRELVKAVELCRELKINFLIIGSGSKMAVSGNGFAGLAIKNRSDNLRIFGIKGKVSRSGLGIEEAFLEVDSGVSLARLSEYGALQKLGGFEVLKSDFGTVGGSIFISQILREKTHMVKVLSLGGEIDEKKLSEVVKSDVVLSVIFKLKAKNEEN